MKTEGRDTPIHDRKKKTTKVNVNKQVREKKYPRVVSLSIID